MRVKSADLRANLAQLRRRLENDSITRRRDLDSLIRIVREDERAKVLDTLESARDRADRETADIGASQDHDGE